MSWTAPSDPPAGARAAVYDLRRAPSAAALGDFASATPVAGVPSPSAPGTVEHARATGLTEGGTYAFAVRSRDAEGNVSATSNVVSATLPHVAPAAVRDLVVESASDTIAMLRWTATGDDGTIGRPQRYLLRAATEPIDAAGFAAAPYAMDAPASTASGGVERARFAGLPAGRRLWFALEAEDAVGTRSLLSNVATSLTGVGGPLAGRAGIGLASGTQPARAPVALWWQTSAVGENAPHRIELYDVRGRMIRAIDLGAGVGGVAQWDGRDGAGRAVRAGLYFARLASVGERTSARIVLLP
ncbi:MAG: hypothetical protein HY076_05195 [Candidatus Eisenbacteria bacterium]|uniref:Fibronectin type-III domain-containing protein n=1 Tax=Eiseniibacteriota bacterium TaxID=2212470 RepID=A0A9D6QMD6_UNCEI|nr:hypothetical protein [Candidatus Eisenbacteria bacterium]